MAAPQPRLTSATQNYKFSINSQLLPYIFRAGASCVYILIGFFSSILLKHLLIVCLSGSFTEVIELFDKILYRNGNTNDAGTVIGFLDIVKAQFYWYGIGKTWF